MDEGQDKSRHIVLTDSTEPARESWWITSKKWIRTPGALYFTALLVLVSGIQAFASWAQWRTLTGQLKTMKDALPSYQKSADGAKNAADAASSSLLLAQKSFKVQQRPYVWNQTPVITHDGPTEGKPIFMNINLINAGVTPALRMGSHTLIQFSEPTQRDFDTLKDLFQQPGSERGGVITPNNPLFITAVSGKHLRPRTIEPMPWNGKDPIFLYGRVEYADVFGDEHWAEFCWQYLLPNQLFQSCAHHNDMDRPSIVLGEN